MSVALDVSDFREWTFERLSAFLDAPHDHDVDWRRFEIVDGALVVSPHAGDRHERVVAMLSGILAMAAPRWAVGQAAAMIGVGRSYLVSDVTVVDAESFGSGRSAHRGEDIVIAVEIESPSSITTDRITKPAQYARAGVQHYWRVELDPLRLVTYALRDGVYVETGSWDASETAVITEPFDVTIDLATLLP